MFCKAIIVFFVILTLLFGILIFTVHDRHHRPILCSKLTASWTCEKEADCPRLHELVKDYEIHHCGRDEHESKICCPPHTHHDHGHDETPEKIPEFKTKYLHKDPVTIVQQKCREYAEYSLVNETIDSQLPDDEKPIQHRIRECIAIEALVVDGQNATEEEFPHMALLGFGETVEDADYLCGGTLISEQFILTAAHCTRPKDQVSGSWAILGSLSRLDATSEKLGQNVFRIVEHINHPDYDDEGKRNDIALYRLEEPVKFTPHIRPVCLATTDTMEVSDSLTNEETKASVAGWGTTVPGFPPSDFLLKATVHILNDGTCESDVSYRDFYETEKMICAGNMGTTQDTCYGDSGGPLQVPIPDLECMWSQIGITARGQLECGSGPAIYTKVAHYIPWIQQIVWP